MWRILIYTKVYWYSHLCELHHVAVLILERRGKGVVVARRSHLYKPVPGRVGVELP